MSATEWNAISRLVDLVHSRLPNYLAMPGGHKKTENNSDSDTEYEDPEDKIPLTEIISEFNSEVERFKETWRGEGSFTFSAGGVEFYLEGEQTHYTENRWGFDVHPTIVTRKAKDLGLVDIFLRMFLKWSSFGIRDIQIDVRYLHQNTLTVITQAVDDINEFSAKNKGCTFSIATTDSGDIGAYTVDDLNADRVAFKNYENVEWDDSGEYPHLTDGFTGSYKDSDEKQ